MRFLLIQGIGFLGTILYLISVKIIKHCFRFNLFPVFLCPTVIDKSTMFTLTLDKYQSVTVMKLPIGYFAEENIMTEGTDFEDCSGGFCTERLLRDIYE